MALIIEGGLDVALPRMAPIRQKFPSPEIPDVNREIQRLVAGDGRMERIRKGSRIAIAVGSRGINQIDRITKALIEQLQQLGARPFIVPAMGSHGGATAEGQRRVLAEYGITAETMGVPVESSMETEEIGQLPNGAPVYLDRTALRSDGIVIIARVKPHTGFRGEYESGLLKMLAIGLGKHKGATWFHSCGIDRFAELLPQLGKVVLEKAPILFGLAIIENAYDRPARFEIVWKEDMIAREPSLLKEAKSLMPKIIPDPLDVLIVQEIGKEISGGGMDPNITGRAASPFFTLEHPPRIQRIVVLRLSEATKGNAIGIGLADVTTRQLVDSINFDYTYVNAITAGIMSGAKIPIAMPTDKEAIQLALKTCFRVKHPETRIVWIRNTLALEKIFASEPLLPEIRRNPHLEILDEPRPMQFDAQGNMIHPPG